MKLRLSILFVFHLILIALFAIAMNQPLYYFDGVDSISFLEHLHGITIILLEVNIFMAVYYLAFLIFRNYEAFRYYFMKLRFLYIVWFAFLLLFSYMIYHFADPQELIFHYLDRLLQYYLYCDITETTLIEHLSYGTGLWLMFLTALTSGIITIFIYTIPNQKGMIL